jgi:uncharacterized membrane protein YheB (UPF0754 family)
VTDSPARPDWKSPATGLATLAVAGASFLVPGEAGRALFLAGCSGFVGWGTNAVAVKMLFDRIRILGIPVPFSGIIPMKRAELIASMSRSVAKHLVSPGSLRDHVLGSDFIGALVEIGRERVRTAATDDATLGMILTEVSTRGRDVVRSPSVRESVRRRVADRIREKGFLARALVDPDAVGGAILDTAEHFLGDLPRDPAAREQLRKLADRLPAAGTAEAKALEEKLKPMAEGMLEATLARIDIEKIVRQNLEKFTDEEIKALVKRSTKEHLGWIEVWGGVLGILAGTAIYVLQRLA